MNRILSITRQQFVFFVCCGMLIALIYSKFALTVGMILLILAGFAKKVSFSGLRQAKDLLVITLFFFLVLISGLYSDDSGYWLERIRIKLPFLLLPLAFINLPKFNTRQYHSLFYFFLIIVSCSAIPVVINYVTHFEEIIQSIHKGKAVPTPINHIRYSLMIAFAILCGALLWWKNFYLKYKWERHLILVLTSFLLVVIHILSVRSGLLVLYLTLGILSLRFVFDTRRYFLGSAMIGAIILAPLIAYQVVPSLQSKINYMQYDFEQYMNGNIKNFSDAERFISIEAGIKIGNKNPVIGVGAGDLKMALAEYYKNEFPNVSHPKMPHNQLVSVYAGTGLLGLIIFLFAFFYPLWYKRNFRDPFLLSICLIVFCSFFVENTLENAIGVAFYTLFLMIGLNISSPSIIRKPL